MSTSIKPSKKLANYLGKITNETGRQIIIEEKNDFGLAGMTAAFLFHPSHIIVRIAPGSQITDPGVERSIAHEVTHGLLIYKKGYCQCVYKRRASDKENKNVSLLVTMIDDIVVNKIIHEEGFSPFGSKYLPMVKEETKAAPEGRDYYNRFSDDLVFKDRFMVFRYIMAWGFLQYFPLEPSVRKQIRKFIKSFQKSYPKQYEMANQIKELILQNDIFTPEGHRNTMERILNLWGLEDLVKLEAV